MLAGLQNWVDERHTAEVDEKQERLTSELIVPNIDVIEKQLVEIRDLVDKRVEAKLRNDAEFGGEGESIPGVFDLRRYPVGCCHLIRDQVLKVLGSAIGQSEAPCMTILNEFEKEGGVLKPVWGIKQSRGRRVFQNVIQTGGYIFDPASDTASFGEKKVTHGMLDDFGFEDIESYEQYLDVVEPYWVVKAYPNVYFPDLAPLYPFLWIRANGTLYFDSLSRSLVAMNVLSGGAEAEKIIFESRIMDRRLPEEYLNLIDKREASREELAESFDAFRYCLSVGEIDKDMLFGANNEVQYFNRRELRG
ncbi:MAG: hypothetical protein ABID64_03245 [Nitrospirota bacterium]